MYFHNRLNHKQNKTNRFNELPTNQFTLPPTLPPDVKNCAKANKQQNTVYISSSRDIPPASNHDSKKLVLSRLKKPELMNILYNKTSIKFTRLVNLKMVNSTE